MAMQNKYEEDTIILREKGVNNQMYMVTSGTVALYVNYGKEEEYLLGLCNKGTVFGEMGILCHSPSIYTAVAVTDVVAATFSEHELDYFIKTYPDKALGIMRSTARLNSVFSLNIKMMMEDHKKDVELLKMYSDAMNANDIQDEYDDSMDGIWHYHKPGDNS